MNLHDLLRNFSRFHASRTSLELESGPGVGKSTSMYDGTAALSSVLNEPTGVATMILSGFDSTDIRGFLMPVKEEGELIARFTRPAVFPNRYNIRVYVAGKVVPNYDGPLPRVGILFLDEFGQADIDVQKPCGQLILDRQIGEYRLPEGWVVWMASNRIADRSGVVKRAMFLRNRAKVMPIEPVYPVWEDWAMRHDVHPLVISFAKMHPNDVFRSSVPDGTGPYATPRSLVLCGQDLMAFRLPEHGKTHLPDDHIATEIALGWLGEATAPVLMSHLRLANDLPDIADVERRPREALVPANLAARYVMAMTLPHHITKKNGGAFITYISRMDKELQILFITNAVRRGPDALNNPEISQWVSTNKDLALIAFGK